MPAHPGFSGTRSTALRTLPHLSRVPGEPSRSREPCAAVSEPEDPPRRCDSPHDRGAALLPAGRLHERPRPPSFVGEHVVDTRQGDEAALDGARGMVDRWSVAKGLEGDGLHGRQGVFHPARHRAAADDQRVPAAAGDAANSRAAAGNVSETPPAPLKPRAGSAGIEGRRRAPGRVCTEGWAESRGRRTRSG